MHTPKKEAEVNQLMVAIKWKKKILKGSSG
jgi:hypothetical protein